MRLVLLDLDGTLIPNPSSESRLMRAMFRAGMIGPRQILAALLFAWRHWKRYGTAVWKKDKAYLSGLERAPVESFARDYAKNALLPQLRPSMRARVEAHRAAGDRLVLLSGAPYFIAEVFAEALGCSDCVATRFVIAQNRFTTAPPSVHPFGADKRRLAEALCLQNGTTLAEAIAYADAADDIALLEASGKAVAVAPDRQLAARAAQSGWEVIAV